MSGGHSGCWREILGRLKHLCLKTLSAPVVHALDTWRFLSLTSVGTSRLGLKSQNHGNIRVGKDL